MHVTVLLLISKKFCWGGGEQCGNVTLPHWRGGGVVRYLDFFGPQMALAERLDAISVFQHEMHSLCRVSRYYLA
jgi:hypothetical protein